jgi:hypothetical protein
MAVTQQRPEEVAIVVGYVEHSLLLQIRHGDGPPDSGRTLTYGDRLAVVGAFFSATTIPGKTYCF